MANLSHSISKLLNPISIKHPKLKSLQYRRNIPLKIQAASSSHSSSNINDVQHDLKKNARRTARTQRRLISISTSSGRWQGQWTHDYVFSLRELQLSDLAENGQQDALVFIRLTVEKHAGFGFSVDGRIGTSYSQKCSSCFSSFCKEIDTMFNVWVLPSSKNRENELPEIGASDPSVIYVQPGSEADLDSLIQETIRLAASGKDTCSESCEKPAIIWQVTDGERSYDQRWSRLLEIKNAM